MKKRYKHEKTSKKQMILVNIILFLACIIAGTMLFFTLKESHLILSAEKTEQISKKSDQQTSTAPSTEQSSATQASDNSSEVNWVQQDSDVSLPILMYHAIHIMAPEEASNANLIVDPTTFESHIKRLSDEGYYFLTPEEAYKVLTENVLPNGNTKIIWLTFDDSLWDFYDNAFPILKKYSAKATNNVITSTVGNSANLSLDQMLEMKEQGISFQSHTSTHPDLSASDDNTQKTEMSDAKSYLDSNLSQDTMTIAYPAGRYSDTTLQLAGELNYKLGITTNEGVADKNDGFLSLDRIRILPETTADSLMASINP